MPNQRSLEHYSSDRRAADRRRGYAPIDFPDAREGHDRRDRNEQESADPSCSICGARIPALRRRPERPIPFAATELCPNCAGGSSTA